MMDGSGGGQGDYPGLRGETIGVLRHSGVRSRGKKIKENVR